MSLLTAAKPTPVDANLGKCIFAATLRSSITPEYDFSGTCNPTFARATTAYYRGSNGLWQVAASGAPRFHYSTAGVALGYLPENAAAQLLSAGTERDMSGATWAKVSTTAALTATGADGVANSASTVTATGAGGTILQTVTAVATERTYGALVRRKTGTGTVTLTHLDASLDITALINSTTYTLVSLTGTKLNATLGFTLATSGDVIEVDFNQFEAGPQATTPIPAGVVRAEDALTYDLVPAFPLTIYAEGLPGKSSTGGDQAYLFGWDDGSWVNQMYSVSLTSDAKYYQGVYAGGASTVNNSGGVSDYVSVHKECFRFATDNTAFFVNGTQIGTTDVSCAMPTGVVTLRIGSLTGRAGAYAYNGTVRNLRIYSKAWSDVTCAAKTA